MARVLYVEDSPAARSVVTRYLEDAGHEVRAFGECAPFVAAAADRPFDLAIVDLLLPDASGQQVLQRLRAVSGAPVLVLTGDDAEASFYAGLSLGADAYLAKPASPRVVVAQVQALLRRGEPDTSPAPAAQTFGPLRWDSAEAAWTCGGERLPLTPQESQLLGHLVGLQGVPVSREELLTQLWGYPVGSPSRAVDEALRRLRVKLDRVGGAVAIETLWGTGVRLVCREGRS